MILGCFPANRDGKGKLNRNAGKCCAFRGVQRIVTLFL